MIIMGLPTASLAHVRSKFSAGRFRDEMLNPLWSAAANRGVDPVGVVAQSMKETATGQFGGQVKPQFYNTCGLKIRHMEMYPGITDNDNPLAHQVFPNWRVGAIAHVQHLMAYAGVPVLHEPILTGRYDYVFGKYSNIIHFENLGGKTEDGRIKWAPSSSYGSELVAIARKLQGA